jgi:hypothetical protein
MLKKQLKLKLSSKYKIHGSQLDDVSSNNPSKQCFQSIGFSCFMKNMLEGTIGGTFTQESPKKASVSLRSRESKMSSMCVQYK